MPYLPVKLEPARLGSIPAHTLPALPAWFPVQPQDEPPMTEQQRTAHRHRHALEQASRGPYDGQRMRVFLEDGEQPPETMVPFEHGDVRYCLDRRRAEEGGSSRHLLVYRYDPSCPGHPAMMRAVEQAFDEASPEYVTTARAEDTKGTRPA